MTSAHLYPLAWGRSTQQNGAKMRQIDLHGYIKYDTSHVLLDIIIYIYMYVYIYIHIGYLCVYISIMCVYLLVSTMCACSSEYDALPTAACFGFGGAMLPQTVPSQCPTM